MVCLPIVTCHILQHQLSSYMYNKKQQKNHEQGIPSKDGNCNLVNRGKMKDAYASYSDGRCMFLVFQMTEPAVVEQQFHCPGLFLRLIHMVMDVVHYITTRLTTRNKSYFATYETASEKTEIEEYMYMHTFGHHYKRASNIGASNRTDVEIFLPLFHNPVLFFFFC